MAMLMAACLIVILHIFLAIRCFLAKAQRRNWDREKVVYLPFYLAAVGLVCGTILSIPTVVCAADRNWGFAFFSVMVLTCDSMMAAYLNCVIRYDEKGFVSKNILGIPRSCTYAEVEGIRPGKDSRIYFRGHVILIDGISRGSDRFLDALDRGHKKATGAWVPVCERKWDPMNGHVDYPWFYFILWIVMGLLSIVLAVLAIYSVTVDTDPAKLVTQPVQFCGYDTYDGTLRLYVEGKEDPYLIEYYEDYGEALPSPEQLCDGKTYTIGTGKNSRSLDLLQDENGKVHITPERERQIYRDHQSIAAWCGACGMVLMAWFCYMGIAVARHPERYSEKVRRLFYKDGYLRY